jgi:hypothetical protein
MTLGFKVHVRLHKIGNYTWSTHLPVSGLFVSTAKFTYSVLEQERNILEWGECALGKRSITTTHLDFAHCFLLRIRESGGAPSSEDGLSSRVNAEQEP